VARKQAAELRQALQTLAPIARPPEPPEPAMSEAEKRASRERIEAMLHRMRQNLKAKPKAQPIEHWRKILSNPYACYIAKKMAQEAIDKIEGTLNEAERIALEAEMQETARRITKAQEQQKLSTGESSKALTD